MTPTIPMLYRKENLAREETVPQLAICCYKKIDSKIRHSTPEIGIHGQVGDVGFKDLCD